MGDGNHPAGKYRVGDRVEMPVYNRREHRFGVVTCVVQTPAGLYYTVRRRDGRDIAVDGTELRPHVTRLLVVGGSVIRTNEQDAVVEFKDKVEPGDAFLYPYEVTDG